MPLVPSSQLLKTEEGLSSLDGHGFHPTDKAEQDMLHFHRSFLPEPSLGLMKNALLGAAMNGDDEVVQQCIRQCIRHEELLAVCDPEGRTALHLAAKWGHANVVRLLLKYNLPVDISIVSTKSREDGWTALHCAVSDGHYEVVTALLSYQASVQVADGNGNTALHLAASQQTGFVIYIIRELLKHGASTTKKNNREQTPLDVAMECGNELVANLLLDWQSCATCPAEMDER